MSIFSFLSRSKAQQIFYKPYKQETVNATYNSLFCDNPDLYKPAKQKMQQYPWNILYAKSPSVSALQSLLDDPMLRNQYRLLAYRRLAALGHPAAQPEMLGIIIEIGFDMGPDTLAVFFDGYINYINQSGKMIIHQADQGTYAFVKTLLEQSKDLRWEGGVLNQPRKQAPDKDIARITLLLPNGTYVAQAPFNEFLAAPQTAPIFDTGTKFLAYLMHLHDKQEKNK